MMPRTIPWRPFSGVREHISTTILAVATMLVIMSIVPLTLFEVSRRRNERMRGVRPT